MEGFEMFLAKVSKVFINPDDFLDLSTKEDTTVFYNDNKNFYQKDSRYLGAIEIQTTETNNSEQIVYPFDKNNITYPILGETVVIIKAINQYFWLPYTNTQYPNYREDFITSLADEDRKIDSGNSKQEDLRKSQNAPKTTQTRNTTNTKKYTVKEKIKFLKPKEGDTVVQGRVGNTIRFSESFLVSDTTAKEPSPSIIIRNKQNPELDSKKIGELVEEDFNKDGSSIYIVSKNVKVPYNHSTIQKEKVGFKNYPQDTDFKGDQIFVNSDRILLSAKANEFIIFGKKNTGIITDGNFSVDAKQDIYLHNEKNITIHSKGSNKIFLNSDSGGKIYLGKDSGEGDAGASVQKMVLGGELVQILTDLIDAITQQMYLTPSGPTQTGPTNIAQFNQLKSKLKTILSAKNFLSKN